VIENSKYDIKMLKNETCKFLCQRKLDEAQKGLFRNMIDDEYLVNWIVDNLPAATRYVRTGSGGDSIMYMNGFPVGVQKDGRYYVHNHVMLSLFFHAEPSLFEGYRVVGFEVEPHSLKQTVQGEGASMTAECKTPLLDLDETQNLVYSYDIQWTWSHTRWASRWDNYLKMTGGQIHWFSILNSCLVVLFLSGMLAMILLRTLCRDIAKYNEKVNAEEAAEETGWKLVHADVFRKPDYSKLFVVCVGSGVQILLMSIVTLIFALMGLLSPARRGSLLQSMMLLFTFMGIFAGYTQARLYKVFNGDDWKSTTLMTAFLWPGVIFAVFFCLNLLIWGEKSSGAVPFTTMFALLVLWFGISVPLVFLGSYMGLQKAAIELPVRTNAVARHIPEQPWFVQPISTALVGGIMPFGAVFTELFFIMSSLWQHQFYYLFGFLALVLVILLVTCAEISIMLTYFQLTAENHRWWWRSFLGSGASAMYVFLYSMFYFTNRLTINKVVPTLLYFGYMGIVSVLFFLLTGSIGAIASFLFVRGIYGSIKVD